MTKLAGRDRLVTMKALAYAMYTIDGLPIEYRETSDRNDMQDLLKRMAATERELHAVLTEVSQHVTCGTAGKLPS